MPGDALHGGGCWGEAQVQIALFGGELAQCSYRHGDGDGGALLG